MRWKLLVPAMALIGALAVGCQSRHLVFVTYTKAGVDVTVADSTPTQAMFGYKRYEGAIIPVEVTREEDDGNGGKKTVEPEAMSVYAAMDLENSWLQGLKILQVFATGQAAQNAAENPSGFAALVREVKKDQEGGQ